jgi:hypothetical protein
MEAKPSEIGPAIKNKHPTTDDTETTEKDGRIFIKQTPNITFHRRERGARGEEMQK